MTCAKTQGFLAKHKVAVAAQTDAVEIVVEDDGPGLPANVADPFDRVGAALARASKTGSGLGLAVVRGVLVAHGGSARAESGAVSRIALNSPAWVTSSGRTALPSSMAMSVAITVAPSSAHLVAITAPNERPGGPTSFAIRRYPDIFYRGERELMA